MRSARIFVVEDETIVARDVRNSLTTLGYEVSGQASSGEDAIRKAGDTQSDLVLMDIRLRGAMDGIEAAERIRERFDIPVIYLTAYADEEILNRARVTEPFGYILKPFDDRELHGAIQMALYRHETERRLVENEERLRNAHQELGKRVAERTAELARANAIMKEQIVERERVEKELRDYRYHLEELVDQRTAELTSAVKQLETEVAERRRTEVALRESQERFRSAFEGAAIGMALVGQDGRILQVNDSLCAMVGYAQDELVGASFEPLTHPEDRPLGKSFSHQIIAGAVGAFQVEIRAVHKLGHAVWLSVNSSVVRDAQGKPWYFVGQFQDITERKRAQDQLEGSLKEKEALLKEVHHRVKNNLQVISSLLNLQAEFTEDRLALETLNQTRNRVRSMALIHEKLYQSGDLARIDFAEYVRGLTSQLFRAYGLDANALAIVVEVSDVLLGIDEAIPCGLIVNELISNSLKHAFPALRDQARAAKGPPGEIRICLCLGEDGKYSFVVSDNGIGFPKGLDFRNTPSLGLQLVTMLVEQLQGSIELRSDGGTEFRITFPA